MIYEVFCASVKRSFLIATKFPTISQTSNYWFGSALSHPLQYNRSINKFYIIIARKRSLRRLCFYTCLSVILFTGGVSASVHAQIHTPPGADTPLEQIHPEQTPHPQSRHPPGLEQTHPQSRHPQSRHPLGADTPQSRHLPGADTPLELTLPWSRHPPLCSASGRHASYWNAYLFRNALKSMRSLVPWQGDTF